MKKIKTLRKNLTKKTRNYRILITSVIFVVLVINKGLYAEPNLNTKYEKMQKLTTGQLGNILNNKSKNKDEKQEAVRLLGSKANDKNAIKILNNSLNSEEDDIKIESAISLYKLNVTTTSIPILNAYLKKGRSEILDKLFIVKKEDDRICKIERLYNTSGEKVLVEALNSKDDMVRAKSASYLVMLDKNALAYNTAINILQNSSSEDAKLFSLTTLGMIGDEKSILAIKSALKDSNKKIRERAEWMLKYIETMKKVNVEQKNIHEK